VALYFADHFRIYSISRFSPFLFLVPAIWGVRQGVHTLRLKRGPALLLAAAITVLMISAWTSNALWILNWLLLSPALYLVATRAAPGSHESCSGSRPLSDADSFRALHHALHAHGSATEASPPSR
jgi:hypothetical protein